MTDRSTVLDRPTPTRGLRTGAVTLLALVSGAAGGTLTSFAQGLLPGPFAGLANGVAPWLVVPFAAGAATRRGRWAPLVGLVACLAQVAGYYVTAHLRGFGVSTSWLVLWLVCALPGGLVAGGAGWSWWRPGEGASPWASRLRGLGGAVLVAAWLAEAVVTYGVVLHYPGHAVVFGVVALVAFLVLGRHGRQHAALARWLLPVLVLACGGFALLHDV